MGVQKEQKSGLGVGLILAVILFDVGLLIWGWHLYQTRQETLDDDGLNFSRAPDPGAAPVVPVAAPPEDTAPSGIERYVKKEVLPEPKPGAPAAAPSGPAAGAKTPAPGGKAPAAAPASPEMKRKMDKAVDSFFALKNSPRFKNSKVVQAWKKDFLSYPDLKALNDEWRREKDPLKFMMGMVRSPNFQKMAAEYLVKPDMRDFVSTMAADKAVKDSASTFMTDESVATAAKAFGLMGPKPGNSAELQKLKEHPALK